MLQISRQSIKALASYSNFKKCCKRSKKGEEKYEENKTSFEGAYLKNSLANSAQIWNWWCLTLRKFTQKILCASVQGVSSYSCMKMAFSLLPHLSVACPRFLEPHDTLPCVLISMFSVNFCRCGS